MLDIQIPMEDIELEAKTRDRVAIEYNTTVRTLLRRLKKKGVSLEPGLIFPNTLKIIYETLGKPGKLSQS